MGIIDQKKLDQIRCWKGKPNPELFEKVIRLFLKQMSLSLKELLRAAGRADSQAVIEIAHTLKSSSGTVGAAELMALCKQVELTSEQNLDLELIDSVQRACSDVEAVLNRELDKLV